MPDQQNVIPADQMKDEEMLTEQASSFDPIDCFKQMVLARAMNDVLKVRKTQGKFDFYIGCAGHEAIAGVTAALRSNDWLTLYYRDLAGWLQRTHDPYAPIRGAYARATDPMTSGRSLSEQFSSRHFHILPYFSEIAALAPFCAGVAFAFKREQTGQLVCFHCGDGGVATNDFNVLYRAATIHQLPVLMVVEENGWAITYPGKQWGGSLVEWARGGGAEAVEMDGSDAIALYETTRVLAEHARTKGPALLHLKIGLLDPHSSSTDIYGYRDRAEVAKTKEIHDPITNTGRRLVQMGLLTESDIDRLKQEARSQVTQIDEQVQGEPLPGGERLLQHVYSFPEKPTVEPIGRPRTLSMLDAVNEALAEIASRDPGFFVYGQDVGSPRGGVFGATQMLVSKFPGTAISSPLNEQLILGIAAGASMVDGRARCGEIQFVEYHQSMAQTLRLAGQIEYQSFGDWNCPVLIRTKVGGGGGGPISSGAGGGGFGHSHSGEHWFTDIPGLIVLCPSTPYDAKGLLIEASRTKSPVIYLERGRLYRSAPPEDAQGQVIEPVAELWQVPEGYYTIPMRKARRIRIGTGSLMGAIVTWGTMMLEAAIAATNVAALYGGAFDIVDLRTLMPFDEETITAVVREANRVVVVTEEPDYSSFGRYVHSWIVQHHFHEMDLPPAFICGKGNIPSVPYNGPEERAFYATSEDIADVLTHFAID
jgi:2-oxoisovalerate dehydrogenase E1 component